VRAREGEKGVEERERERERGSEYVSYPVLI